MGDASKIGRSLPEPAEDYAALLTAFPPASRSARKRIPAASDRTTAAGPATYEAPHLGHSFPVSLRPSRARGHRRRQLRLRPIPSAHGIRYISRLASSTQFTSRFGVVPADSTLQSHREHTLSPDPTMRIGVVTHDVQRNSHFLSQCHRAVNQASLAVRIVLR